MPRIILLVGLPGSGKSTYARRLRWPVISSDHLRSLIADDATDQSVHGPVFAAVRYLLRKRLEVGRPLTCIDATHLTPRERRPYFKIAERYGCQLEAVFFDVPVQVCQERNRQRDRVVPQQAIERMALKLVAPTVEEGFSRVTVIRE
jgi:predicted kinase